MPSIKKRRQTRRRPRKSRRRHVALPRALQWGGARNIEHHYFIHGIADMNERTFTKPDRRFEYVLNLPGGPRITTGEHFRVKHQFVTWTPLSAGIVRRLAPVCIDGILDYMMGYRPTDVWFEKRDDVTNWDRGCGCERTTYTDYPNLKLTNDPEQRANAAFGVMYKKADGKYEIIDAPAYGSYYLRRFVNSATHHYNKNFLALDNDNIDPSGIGSGSFMYLHLLMDSPIRIE